jgi:hypothetical protein
MEGGFLNKGYVLRTEIPGHPMFIGVFSCAFLKVPGSPMILQETRKSLSKSSHKEDRVLHHE